MKKYKYAFEKSIEKIREIQYASQIENLGYEIIFNHRLKQSSFQVDLFAINRKKKSIIIGEFTTLLNKEKVQQSKSFQSEVRSYLLQEYPSYKVTFKLFLIKPILKENQKFKVDRIEYLINYIVKKFYLKQLKDLDENFQKIVRFENITVINIEIGVKTVSIDGFGYLVYKVLGEDNKSSITDPEYFEYSFEVKLRGLMNKRARKEYFINPFFNFYL